MMIIPARHDAMPRAEIRKHRVPSGPLWSRNQKADYQTAYSYDREYLVIMMPPAVLCSPMQTSRQARGIKISALFAQSVAVAPIHIQAYSYLEYGNFNKFRNKVCLLLSYATEMKPAQSLLIAPCQARSARRQPAPHRPAGYEYARRARCGNAARAGYPGSAPGCQWRQGQARPT